MQPARITELWIYPIKSCRGVPVAQARLGPRGLDGDREWMIADTQGRFLTQRTLPGLARLQPSLTPETLQLRAPNLPDLVLPRAPSVLRGAAVTATIWNDTVETMDAGDTAANWLQQALGVEARLLRATDRTRRQPDARWLQGIPAPVNFPDGFPLLVCNTASLAMLNERMPTPVPMDRFRPNVVIDGPAAFAEDELDVLRSAAIELRLVKPCTRCSTTVVDQQTGLPGSNPLPALKSFRFDRELLGVTFGMNAIIAHGIGENLHPGPLTMMKS